MVIWRMVPHCVIWCLWKERNARLFEDCESSMVDIKLLFFQTLYAWVNSVGVFPINSITELIDRPLLFLNSLEVSCILLVFKAYFF